MTDNLTDMLRLPHPNRAHLYVALNACMALRSFKGLGKAP